MNKYGRNTPFNDNFGIGAFINHSSFRDSDTNVKASVPQIWTRTLYFLLKLILPVTKNEKPIDRWIDRWIDKQIEIEMHVHAHK